MHWNGREGGREEDALEFEEEGYRRLGLTVSDVKPEVREEGREGGREGGGEEENRVSLSRNKCTNQLLLRLPFFFSLPFHPSLPPSLPPSLGFP